jgi:hypothetical protein
MIMTESSSHCRDGGTHNRTGLVEVELGMTQRAEILSCKRVASLRRLALSEYGAGIVQYRRLESYRIPRSPFFACVSMILRYCACCMSTALVKPFEQVCQGSDLNTFVLCDVKSECALKQPMSSADVPMGRIACRRQEECCQRGRIGS